MDSQLEEEDSVLKRMIVSVSRVQTHPSVHVCVREGNMGVENVNNVKKKTTIRN